MGQTTARLTTSAAGNLSYERRVLLDTFITGLRAKTGNPNLLVTSTGRNSTDQARAMYNNYMANPSYQRSLYGAQGQKVLNYFDANRGKPGSEIINGAAGLIDRLTAESPSRPVSRHLNTYQTVNGLFVFDLGYSGISNKQKLLTELNKTEGINIIDEPQNGALHVEVGSQQLKERNAALLNIGKPKTEVPANGKTPEFKMKF
jgi:hypothetical protein